MTNTKGVVFFVSEADTPSISLHYFRGSYFDMIPYYHAIHYTHYAYLYNTNTYRVYGQVMENSGGSATLDRETLGWISASLLRR